MLLKSSKNKLRRTVGMIFECNNCNIHFTSNEIGICSKCANLYENNQIHLKPEIKKELPYYICKKYKEFVEEYKV